MIRRGVRWCVLVGLCFAVVESLPSIARYLDNLEMSRDEPGTDPEA